MTCEYCEKPIRFFELSSMVYQHNFIGGEHHGLGCSYIMRGIGVLSKLVIFLLFIPAIIINALSLIIIRLINYFKKLNTTF